MGAVIDDMVTFLAHCHEPVRQEYIHVLQLFCFCLSHTCHALPSVRHGSQTRGIETVDLSTSIAPLQSYRLSRELESTLFYRSGVNCKIC